MKVALSVQDQKIARALAVALLAMCVTMSAAQADDDRDRKYGEKYSGENRGKSVQPAEISVKLQQECSACHIVYSSDLLPAESWRKIMAGLDKHFGSDASITAQENNEITDFLVNNASSRWSAPTAPLRISETAWFRRKHDSPEISPEIWKNPKVKSPANCAACHPQAERGDFNEHGIRMPR